MRTPTKPIACGAAVMAAAAAAVVLVTGSAAADTTVTEGSQEVVRDGVVHRTTEESQTGIGSTEDSEDSEDDKLGGPRFQRWVPND
jgi:hypothetical protein